MCVDVETEFKAMTVTDRNLTGARPDSQDHRHRVAQAARMTHASAVRIYSTLSSASIGGQDIWHRCCAAEVLPHGAIIDVV
jgi:hypothetical protein